MLSFAFLVGGRENPASALAARSAFASEHVTQIAGDAHAAGARRRPRAAEADW
jgi:hypothetical protein